jgi:hypothetical protein
LWDRVCMTAAMLVMESTFEAVLGWKMFGLERTLGTRLVTYADDLVILCRRGKAEAALHPRLAAAEVGLPSPFHRLCGPLRAREVESLWPQNFVSKVAVCHVSTALI